MNLERKLIIDATGTSAPPAGFGSGTGFKAFTQFTVPDCRLVAVDVDLIAEGVGGPADWNISLRVLSGAGTAIDLRAMNGSILKFSLGSNEVTGRFYTEASATAGMRELWVGGTIEPNVELLTNQAVAGTRLRAYAVFLHP